MLFNSYEFIFIFLPIVWVGFFSISHFKTKLASIWLAIASLIFYGYWSKTYVLLLIASIAVNYMMGIFIAKSLATKNNSKTLLQIALFLNIALLIYYKYANFFIISINEAVGTYWVINNIVLPLGISFFTFTQIAFLVDTYQGKVKEYNFTHYLLFVTYFPHLIAGPVIHHKQMMPQFSLASTYKPSFENLFFGFSFFSIGLAKKVLLADNLATYASPIFSASNVGVDVQFFGAWVGALAFTFQLYFDFSGYSDMAIGISRMFGVTLPINFNSPYRSKNIIEFWRRWHISLSTFLRDYLYIPLGGNRNGSINRYFNLMVTMLLGGLWHGANWTFLLWGAIHGVYLCLNYYWKYILGNAYIFNNKVISFLGIVTTFISVVFAWVFFRSESLSASLIMIKGLIGINGVSLPLSLNYTAPYLKGLPFNIEYSGLFNGLNIPLDLTRLIFVFGISFIVVWGFPNSQQLLMTSQIEKYSKINRIAFTSFMGSLFAVSILSFKHVSEFLYFQF
jgi:alginate O-acetyltransferase complex protein AlgI